MSLQNDIMISKTYYRYIWLLDTLLTSDPLPYDDICMLWEDCPAFDGPLPLRTFHEHRKGIKEMFGVDIECDRSKGNVYYVKNPEVLDKNKLAKWLLRKYSIPQDFDTFNGMKDRILLDEMTKGSFWKKCTICWNKRKSLNSLPPRHYWIKARNQSSYLLSLTSQEKTNLRIS